MIRTDWGVGSTSEKEFIEVVVMWVRLRCAAWQSIPGPLGSMEVHWAILLIQCTVYIEPASKNCAEGFAL